MIYFLGIAVAIGAASAFVLSWRPMLAINCGLATAAVVALIETSNTRALPWIGLAFVLLQVSYVVTGVAMEALRTHRAVNTESRARRQSDQTSVQRCPHDPEQTQG